MAMFTPTLRPQSPQNYKLQIRHTKKNYFVLSVKGRGKSFNDFLNDAETDIGPVNNPTICIKFPLILALSEKNFKSQQKPLFI